MNFFSLQQLAEREGRTCVKPVADYIPSHRTRGIDLFLIAWWEECLNSFWLSRIYLGSLHTDTHVLSISLAFTLGQNHSRVINNLIKRYLPEVWYHGSLACWMPQNASKRKCWLDASAEQSMGQGGVFVTWMSQTPDWNTFGLCNWKYVWNRREHKTMT